MAAISDAQARVASEHTWHVKSKYSVELTVERAKRIAEYSEFKVFGVIDHAHHAAAAGIDLVPVQLIVFGDVAAAAELMAANPLLGLDLPLKLLVWEDYQGVVWISYSAMESIQRRHKLDKYTQQFLKAERLLRDLARAAGH